jgi:hypothetical protein
VLIRPERVLPCRGLVDLAKCLAFSARVTGDSLSARAFETCLREPDRRAVRGCGRVGASPRLLAKSIPWGWETEARDLKMAVNNRLFV